MKIMKWVLFSNFFAGTVMVFIGAYTQAQHYNSSGLFELGGIAIFFALLMWVLLGYHKHKIPM